MFGHLGAKTGEQERKMRRMRSLEGVGGAARKRNESRVRRLELPPSPGAPNSTWKPVELRLWMELSTDQVTQHMPKGTWQI